MKYIYEVRAQSGDRVHAFGTRRTRAEAEQLLADSRSRVETVGGHNDRYWIEEIDTTGLFTVPSRPTPRERFTIRSVVRAQTGNHWPTTDVEVIDDGQVIATYHRNYRMLRTFEPFRQGDRSFALISPDYTATSVMDLDTGRVIAAEKPSATGFCPVGFYVPDWWDVHDGTTLPGSMWWEPDDEWPGDGSFGFVWGCAWGDDSSWKVQYLDLSGIQDGVIRRDERFGYVRLADRPDLPAADFICCSSSNGRHQVELVVEQTHDLTTGERIDPEV